MCRCDIVDIITLPCEFYDDTLCYRCHHTEKCVYDFYDSIQNALINGMISMLYAEGECDDN